MNSFGGDYASADRDEDEVVSDSSDDSFDEGDGEESPASASAPTFFTGVDVEELSRPEEKKAPAVEEKVPENVYPQTIIPTGVKK
jgi:hypothetical protein